MSEWQRSDLDFPVLRLASDNLLWTVGGLGGGPLHGLTEVDVQYGGEQDTLRLQTRARRGCRISAGGARGQTDHLPSVAGEAVSSLLLRAVKSRTGEELSARIDEAVDVGRRLAREWPRPPWQLREAPVGGVPFALWVYVRDEGFAAVLDLGPVLMLAVGDDVDAWDWNLAAAPPDEIWPRVLASDAF